MEKEKQLIKVCESRYGGTTCIYHYINPNQIVELHIEETQNEINIEATLTNGLRVIIMYLDDVKPLVGEEELGKIIEEIKEKYENRTKQHLFG